MPAPISRGQQIESTYWVDDEVVVELAPGEASLHHGLTAHGSGPNITDARRVGVVIRYVSPDVRPARGTDFAMVCRGENTTGYLRVVDGPEADFDDVSLERFGEISAVQAENLAAGAEQALSYSRTAEP